MTELEPRCHRWVQITKEFFDKNIENKKILYQIKPSHEYTSVDGTNMYELHVDTCSFIQSIGESHPVTGKWGGRVSVRSNTNMKPIMIIGQDESVFHQYSLVTKQWVGADGQRALLPKSEGAGIMISAFQVREIGIPQEIDKIF